MLQYHIYSSFRRMFGQGSIGSDMTFGDYWRQLTITFKGLLILSLTLGLLGAIFPFVSAAFANSVYETVNRVQLWRLFTSLLVDRSIINILFNLYILSTILPGLERKHSTVYIAVEIFVQTICCNLIFIVIAEILNLLTTADIRLFTVYGLTNLILVFLWQLVAVGPESLARFCCLPCVMPAKYLPWCFAAILFLQGSFGALIGCLVGYYQHMKFKIRLIPIPFSFYSGIEQHLPVKVKKSEGFISIHSVDNSLIAYPDYSPSNASPEANELVYDGVGVPIGGVESHQPSDYKKHWLDQEKQSEQSPKKKQSEHLSSETLRTEDKEISENEKEQQASVQRLTSDLI